MTITKSSSEYFWFMSSSWQLAQFNMYQYLNQSYQFSPWSIIFGSLQFCISFCMLAFESDAV